MVEIDVATDEEIREGCEKDAKAMKKEMMKQLKQPIKLGEQKGIPMEVEKDLYRDLKELEEADEIADRIIQYKNERDI